MSKILVVDDDPIVVLVVTATLQREHYQVLTAASAAEALQQATLHEGDISLLVIDRSVGIQSEGNLLGKILARQPQMKVLRCSGYLESTMRSAGEICQGSFFIQKPFLPAQLIDKVREIIGPAYLRAD